MAPNTGAVENGVVLMHPGFNPRGTGGILDNFQFRNGDFRLAGYSHAMVRIRRAPAVTENRNYTTMLNGANEVPAVMTPAVARGAALLRDNGTRLVIRLVQSNLTNVVAAHLHLAPAGQNGPVIVNLLGPLAPGGGAYPTNVMMFDVRGRDLTGPLADYPLDALVHEIEAGNVYINIHTNDGDPMTNGAPGDIASGEIRGQLSRL